MAEDGAAGESAEVRWVGEQHLMRGYCGRATYTGQDASGALTLPTLRPVVLVVRQRRPVVRIGPRPTTMEQQPTARAA